jgi:hypothetical protein
VIALGSVALVTARVLAGQWRVVLIVLGAVIIVLGVLRFFRLAPRLSLNVFGTSDRPMLQGILTIIVGAAVVIIALVR